MGKTIFVLIAFAALGFALYQFRAPILEVVTVYIPQVSQIGELGKGAWLWVQRSWTTVLASIGGAFTLASLTYSKMKSQLQQKTSEQVETAQAETAQVMQQKAELTQEVTNLKDEVSTLKNEKTAILNLEEKYTQALTKIDDMEKELIKFRAQRNELEMALKTVKQPATDTMIKLLQQDGYIVRKAVA